jgi:hypothetical protein
VVTAEGLLDEPELDPALEELELLEAPAELLESSEDELESSSDDEVVSSDALV